MNSSMQRFLAARGKMVHVSRPLVPTPVTYADGTLGAEMLPAPDGSKANKTLNTGRNAAKRAKRAEDARMPRWMRKANKHCPSHRFLRRATVAEADIPRVQAAMRAARA